MTLSHVLFDLDGTLIDTVHLIFTCYRRTLQEHRGSIPPDAMWLQGLGTPLLDQFRQFSDDPHEVAAMAATYRRHHRRHHDALIREYPGVREAVRRLKARGIGLGIVSSKLRDGCLRGLARCRLDGLFDVIVAADDVDRPKPHPEPVRRALTQLGAHAERTIFVGDSPHDLAAGSAAGVWTAAVAWGPFPRATLAAKQPHWWVSHPEELASLGATDG